MSFNGSYTVSQGADISSVVITDTSSGTDVNITGRTIAIYLTDGSLLTGSTFDWPLSDGDNITLTGIISKDISTSIVVTWSSSAPLAPPSTYTSTQIVTFVGYTDSFLYSLVQRLTAMPNTINDTDFEINYFKLNNNLSGAIRATNYSNQFLAQASLDRAQYMITNQSLFF